MLLSPLYRVITWISAASEPRWLLVLGLVSLAPRVLSAVLVPTIPVGDFSWYDGRAAELATGLGYQYNGEPTSFWPPGYPFTLSLVYRLFGHSWLAGRLLNALLGTAVCVLTYLVAKKMVTVTRARVAALLVTFFPSQILFTNPLGTEVLFTVLLLVVLYLLLDRPVAHQGYRYLAVVGVAVGLAAYVKTLALFLPLVIFVWWLLAGTRFRRASARLLVVLLCAFAVIMPWTVRNVVKMGSPVVLSTNGGANLWIGNNPGASGYFYFPPDNPLQSENFDGEVERDYEGYRLALEFARERPLRVIALMPKKVYHLLASDVYAANTATQKLRHPLPVVMRSALGIVSQHYYLAVLGLAAVSILLLKGWRQRPTAPIVLVFGYWAIVHAIYFGADRFHFPLVPLFCILAAEAIGAFWTGGLFRHKSPDTRQQTQHDVYHLSHEPAPRVD